MIPLSGSRGIMGEDFQGVCLEDSLELGRIMGFGQNCLVSGVQPINEQAEKLGVLKE